MRTLLSIVRAERLTSFHLEKLNVIDTADFSSVRRKTLEDLRKQGLDPSDLYLDEGILALKQYYAIALLDPRNMHAVSDLVDPFWHAHILHTHDYIEFCDRAVGGYMHHDPLDHANVHRLERVAHLYSYTVECFEQFFNYVNPDFFPQTLPEPRLICVHFGNTISQYGQDSNLILLPEIAEMQPASVLV